MILCAIYQDPPTGFLETLTGGFWAPVVTRKHLLEGAGIYYIDPPKWSVWER